MAVFLCTLVPLAAGAPQKTTVNTSRSNIKSNISVMPGANGTLLCAVEGKPCTADNIKPISDALTANKTPIQRLTVAPNDGAFQCDGKTCTAAQQVLEESHAAVNGVNDPIKGVGIGLGKNPDPQK